MKVLYYLFSFLALSDAATYLYKSKPLLVKSCKVGERVENYCNKCICSKHLVYECTPITACEITPNNSSSISTCPANSIFVSNETICICNRNGQWPHKNCNRIFQSFAKENTCSPGTYVNVDCNICRCGTDGKIDKQHCTRNNCENLFMSGNLRKSRVLSQSVFGYCLPENWYSLGPCQLCYCISENKLECTEKGNNSITENLQDNNITLCGKYLIEEAVKIKELSKAVLKSGVD